MSEYINGWYYSMFDLDRIFPMCEDCRIGGNLSGEGIYPNIKFKKYKCCSDGCFYYEKPKRKKEMFIFSCINAQANRIPFTVENINIAIKWANNWFNEEKYSKYFWWFESGKNIEKPSLHIHFIWKKSKTLNTQNHKRSLCCSWDNIPFKGPLQWEPGNDSCGKIKPGKIWGNKDYDYEGFSDEMLDDKIIYAINSSKDTHENFKDLIMDPHEGQMRAWGGCKSLTAKYKDLRAVEV